MNLKEIVEAAWENRDLLREEATVNAVFEVVDQLDRGILRVAEKGNDGWKVNDWSKKAVFLYFWIVDYPSPPDEWVYDIYKKFGDRDDFVMAGVALGGDADAVRTKCDQWDMRWPQLYEAGKIDGANAFQLFRHITIPLMTPTIFFNLVMGLIGSFQYFTGAFVLTGGGPLFSTYFYNLMLYERAFKWVQMGMASAMAWFLLVVVLLLTLLVFRSSTMWVYYETEVK